MDLAKFEKISTQIFTRLSEQPDRGISEILETLDSSEKKELTSYILQYYGGSSSHDFLLKANSLVFNFTNSDWNEVFDSIQYNESLGRESLYTFFIYHTSVRNIEFFENLGIGENLRSRFNAIFSEGSYEDLPNPFKSRNNQNYERLGISKEESSTINEFTISN